MHIVVCVKQIADPEVPAAQFRVDETAKQAVFWPGTRSVISPFDEQALEAALRLRDALGEAKITTVTLGPEPARAAIKAALSMGADAAVLLRDAAFDGCDARTTAHALAAAIRKLDPVDLVLTGRQAADLDAGVVGLGVAELLGLPAISCAKALRLAEGMLTVERVVGDGIETVETALPALVTVSHELGAPRKASLRETMRAAKKPVTLWSAANLGLDAAQLAPRRVVERLHAPVNDVSCEFIAGDSPEQAALALIDRLKQARLT